MPRKMIVLIAALFAMIGLGATGLASANVATASPNLQVFPGKCFTVRANVGSGVVGLCF